MTRVRVLLLSLIAVFCLGLPSSGQSYGRGKVFDPSGMPLAGAWVRAYGDRFETAVTDSKGKFRIKVPADEPPTYG